MKRIKVKYTPPFVYGVSAVAAMLLIFTGNSICEGVGAYAGGAAALILFVWGVSMGTYVEFGEGNIIRCRSIFYTWKIDLDKMERFSYSIDKEGLRNGSQRYSFNLRFYHSTYGFEKCCLLRKSLDEKEIKRFMIGQTDNIELMQVYKYAGSVCPGKAKGYIEDSGYFE